MYRNLNGKVALVTGGSKGIGLAIAERFIIEKSKVCAISRHKPEKPNDDIIYFECDVSSEKSVKETTKAIKETVGSVDILVNNAGIENYAPVASTSVKMWDSIMNVNVKGAFLMSREWDKSIFPTVWIWRCLGGGSKDPWYGRQYATSVEITSSWPVTGISKQVENNTALSIGGNESISTFLNYKLLIH